MAIFGALGGGALRLAPVLIDAFLNRNAKTNEIELARIDLEKTRVEADASIARVDAQASLSESQASANAALAQAQATLAAQQAVLVAQQAQAQLSGVGWIDAMNLAVRPTITLWLLLLYTVYKTMLVVIAALQHAPFDDIAKVLWNDDDISIFAGAITFWFVDQAMAGVRPPRKR